MWYFKKGYFSINFFGNIPIKEKANIKTKFIFIADLNFVKYFLNEIAEVKVKIRVKEKNILHNMHNLNN